MNPPPDRGRSRYGAPARQFPFVVDPKEAAGVRAFFPAPEAGGEPPPSSSAQRSPVPHQQRYGGGGAEISLGHAHAHGQQGNAMHRYHQFGVEARMTNLQDGRGGGGTSSGSSPAGFFSSPVVDNGFPSARVGGADSNHAMDNYNKKLKSPMNLLARQGNFSQISQDGTPNLTENMHDIDHSEENIAASNVIPSFPCGFSIGSWEDSKSIAFSNPTSKVEMHNNDDIIATLSNYEMQFGATKETTAGLDKYMQRQQDQVPFRVRAKRGCATHPRSIAERERRIRISEKLKKLEALVPNMDKQTSTADMLDLAVERIRVLESELQALKEEKEKCTCHGN